MLYLKRNNSRMIVLDEDNKVYKFYLSFTKHLIEQLRVFPLFYHGLLVKQKVIWKLRLVILGENKSYFADVIIFPRRYFRRMEVILGM